MRFLRAGLEMARGAERRLGQVGRIGVDARSRKTISTTQRASTRAMTFKPRSMASQAKPAWNGSPWPNLHGR